MRVEFANDIVIGRPSAQVAEFAANPDNAPTWYSSIKAVRWLTAPPVRRGTRIDFVAHFLGTRMSYTYEVIEHVLCRRLVMRTVHGIFPVETSYTWEPVGSDSTRMTLRHQGSAPGPLKLIARPVGHAMQHANRQDLLNLKRILESGAYDRPVR